MRQTQLECEYGMMTIGKEILYMIHGVHCCLVSLISDNTQREIFVVQEV